MVLQNTLRSLLVAVVLALGAVTGAVVLDGVPGVGSEDPDPDSLVEPTLESDGAPYDTLNASRETAVETRETPGEESERAATVAEVEKDPPDRLRTEIRAASGVDAAPGDVTVVDGDVRKHYFAADERMLVDDESDWTVPSGWSAERVEEYETTYVGPDEVDGRETHVVELVPGSDATGAVSLHVGNRQLEATVGEDAEELADAPGRTTWWVDEETGVVVREVVELAVAADDTADGAAPEDVDGDWTRRIVTEYRNLTVDEPIADDRFEFDPPPDTETYEPVESVAVETVAEADAVVPFAVPEPDVPDRFEYRDANANEFEDAYTAEFYYRTDSEPAEDVWVRITERPALYDEDDVLEREVGPHDGDLAETHLGTTYAWSCDGVRHEVSVDLAVEETNVEAEDEKTLAIELAATMPCG
ncbi:LolA family protein [Halorubrum vacuolatum]|uniref:Outer membrane lipoprotein-sorting protein n=1 Tax=Halorubrum vacuolatum TaxID=63740 RepID=A0A238VC67_HALVU|nr:hypothetical protein [Halorubrum vacuolatum]SNR31754.1 hypothetical protein SAMN06264855_102221 [Halorubrum vacuolatum]